MVAANFDEFKKTNSWRRWLSIATICDPFIVLLKDQREQASEFLLIGNNMREVYGTSLLAMSITQAVWMGMEGNGRLDSLDLWFESVQLFLHSSPSAVVLLLCTVKSLLM